MVILTRMARVFLLAAPAGLAWAQAPAPAAPAPVVTEIVVEGERSKVETRVDRRIYAVAQDLQGTLGSAADVLRNVPSVDIDIDGSPSLRGDAGVTIFIDGRFAPAFNNANRGAALQQLAADGIDRIEVITNPPANFKREGSGGVINIVTRRKPGSRTASARASVGNRGRYTVGASQGVSSGKLDLRGSATLRRDLRIRGVTESRTLLDEFTGAVRSHRELRAGGEDDRSMKALSLGADYEPSGGDRLSAEVDSRRRDSDSFFHDRFAVADSSGVPTSDYLRARRSDEYEHETEIVLAWRHQGERDGDGLEVSLQISDETEHRPLRFAEAFSLPPQPELFQRQDFFEHGVVTELGVESSRSFDSKARWISGYDLVHEDGVFEVEQTLPAAAAPFAIDPNFTNRLAFTQTVHALFTTFEQPFGKWTTLTGLRVESVDRDIHQVTSGERGSRSFFDVYPSLHVSCELNERQMLTFSYSQRVFRPNWQSLNPYPVRIDEFTLRQGNPQLRPAKVDSFEAAWAYERGQTTFSATAHARRVTDDVDFVTTPVSATSVVVQPQNIGETVSGGLELVASARPWSWADFSFTLNSFYTRLDASNVGFSARRSTVNHDGKAALNLRTGEKSRVQLNLGSFGKRLTPQGYRKGNTVLDAGYRYQLRGNFAVVGTVSDVFASRRNRVVLDAPDVSSVNSIKQPGRIIHLGVAWTLADKGDKAERFEYEQ